MYYMFSKLKPLLLFSGIQRDYLLLGDSGYPLFGWLMTPFVSPQTPSEHRYNQAHKTTRSVVERTIGIVKRRFPGLQVGLRQQPRRAAATIMAAMCLHNVAVERREPLEEGPDQHDDMHAAPDLPDDHVGRIARDGLVRNVFEV